MFICYVFLNKSHQNRQKFQAINHQIVKLTEDSHSVQPHTDIWVKYIHLRPQQQGKSCGVRTHIAGLQPLHNPPLK